MNMRYAIILAILLYPVTLIAGEHPIARGESTKMTVNVDHMRETMIVLPDTAVSVTGVGQPSFQVEPGSDYVMLRALKQNSRGNLFINFGGGTIVSIKISTVQSGGEQLVTLKYSAPVAYGVTSGMGSLGDTLDVRAQAAPWKVKKLGSKSRNAGFTARAEYSIETGDRIFVNITISNDSGESLNISKVNLIRNTLGGLKGMTVLESVEVPSECAFDVRSLSPGEKAYGTIAFPKTYVDFDQALVLQVRSASNEGPDLRIGL